ncbi:MAG: carbon starvation protein A, partial [Burkholderiaceae bacterium]|nr:carbon starvation protein A [Burkholderiaceae bacterium]
MPEIIRRHLPWAALAILGAFALATVALGRGEAVSALWVVIAGVCVYLIAYRYYSLFLANTVLELDAKRMTPAWRHNDGLDYVPTHKGVLYGHHFAAIAGAGPLVGPVLAAQMGYLPGLLWILAGVVFAGAVQDFIVLFISTRRDGRSLGDLIKQEMGTVPGVIALFGCFMIMIIILAVLALIVVKALAHSPWGTFTVAATIPVALFMGIYSRFIRPGRIGEVSIIGFVLLMLSIFGGQWVSESATLGPMFTFDGKALTWMLIGYGFVAASIPVWLLLAPRDYLSTFLKIGTIIALAIGIVIVGPELKMPALTQFAGGGGPVWSGSMFPFLFITIACGAVSGFHALISSGTTPKMLENETHARFIGYGGMLAESFVAVMALVAASCIEPGIYFAMNSPAALVGSDVNAVAQTLSTWGFVITPEMLTQTAKDVGESTILARTGGAPTLAVGMAHILHQVVGGKSMMAFWYHFAILFEALRSEER